MDKGNKSHNTCFSTLPQETCEADYAAHAAPGLSFSSIPWCLLMLPVVFAVLLTGFSADAMADGGMQANASAKKVLYLLSNIDNYDQRILDALEELNFTVDRVDNEDLASVNWGAYSFMLVADASFSNYMDIPVNDFPAIILNTRYIDDWHWTSRVSAKTSSQPISVHINQPAGFISDGMPLNVQAYTSSSPSIYYLHRYYKAPSLKTVASTSNSSYWETFNSVIATAVPGTKLKDSHTSNAKAVFFGIKNSEYWTQDSEQLFKRSALWLVTDLVPPAILNITESGITNSSAVISWQTDKEADSTVEYWPDGANISEPSFKTTHSVALSGLSEDTIYSYRITSCNINSVCNTTSELQFKTGDYTAPDFLFYGGQNITNSSAAISAEINEEGTASLFYGTIPSNLDGSYNASGTGTFWVFNISGLSDKTTYYYYIEACDDSSNCRNSSASSFTTLDITPPEKPSGYAIEIVGGTNIHLSWSPPLDDASVFNIYTSLQPYSFNFSSPAASTSSYEYTDNLAELEQQKYYIVRAEDSHGNEEGNQDVLGKYTLSVGPGYSLVSLPLVPLDTGIDSVMHQDILYSPVSQILRYDKVSQGFQESSFSSGIWDKSEFSVLEYGEGYFLFFDEQTDFTFAGSLPEEAQHEIMEGMNLVGLAFLEDAGIEEAISQSPSGFNVTELAKRSQSGEYTISVYNGSGWHNSFALEPGKGYWLKSKNNFTLVRKK